MATYNLRSPAVKRLLQEARELQQDNCCDYTAQPLEDNLFEWHFVIRGPDGTEFEGGRYHGRILLPSEYPFKPPNLMLSTPNGRFELNKKICLSITGYHPEYWLPAWGTNGAIGGIDYTEAERRLLARKSHNWICYTCGISNIDKLPDDKSNTHQSSHTSSEDSLDSKVSKENEIMPQFSFVYDDERRVNDKDNNDHTSKGKNSASSSTSFISAQSVDSESTTNHRDTKPNESSMPETSPVKQQSSMPETSPVERRSTIAPSPSRNSSYPAPSFSEKTSIIKDLAADPSLAKKTCTQCGFTVAVHFEAQSRRIDTKMTLYYACGNINCGYRWTDFDNENTDFHAIQDEEYDDQDYLGREDYDVANQIDQIDDANYEDLSYPVENIESEAIDTSAAQYQHNPEDW
ncbi:24244_t:CDS:10 [Cetraspora pellucida]|uniref:24244_t:CDS:1 n=1 Tax=Cetraspora pellucida TaxID=1433469 RepID=A0A9N8ZIZ0_9GLOM|nr:24244_t:CDS:10 [Cetraspora pellucida]